MSKPQLTNVNFDIIRYANCWEDADILLKGLACQPSNKIISIASGGCNSFSLLTTNPEIVVAVDVSPVQLYLVELKKVAIQHLAREEYLAFVGFTPSSSRLKTFELLKKDLSKDSRSYWEYYERFIKKGIIDNGKFERYLRGFCTWLLPLVHARKTRKALIAPKTHQEQIDFYNNKWDSWNYKLLFKIFFSRAVMGRLGRDPEFFNQVGVNVGNFIHNKAGEHLQTTYAQHNHILHYALMGYFGEELPNYCQAQNYDIIKSNIDRLVLHQGLLESAFHKYGNFDRFNLSNIFEYMDIPTFEIVGKQIIDNAVESARFGHWCLMVPRYLEDISAASQLGELSNRLSSIDKGFFYREFVVSEL